MGGPLGLAWTALAFGFCESCSFGPPGSVSIMCGVGRDSRSWQEVWITELPGSRLPVPLGGGKRNSVGTKTARNSHVRSEIEKSPSHLESVQHRDSVM